MRVKLACLGILLASGAQAGIVFTSATSSTAAGLQSAIDAFRASIGGGTVAGANGSFGGIRREINWDGVPDSSADPNLMPATFFINTSPRGLALSGAVTGFEVSANPGLPTPALFESFDSNNTYDFQAFSANRIFSGINGTDFDVSFFEPGTGFTNPSFTLAFGVIFIDPTGSTFPTCASLTAFNGAQALGFRCASVPGGGGGFSFLGITATGGDVLTRVAVHQGNSVLGTPIDATHTVVPLDDFIYAEPGLTELAPEVPEPSTYALSAIGFAIVAAAARRKRLRA